MLKRILRHLLWGVASAAKTLGGTFQFLVVVVKWEKQFQYDALEEDEIRVLEFQRQGSTKSSTVLSFRLHHIKRPARIEAKADDSSPYHALSYTWGSGDFNTAIYINNARFFITEDLHAALRYLSSDGAFERPFYLWVDAICINQENNDEKTIQVSRMKQTYQDAHQVIVWLGYEPERRDTTGRAAEFLEALLPPFPDGGTPMTPQDQFETALRDEANSAITYTIGRDVMRRPWWWRVWVIQEVAVARSVAVLCDGYRFSWDQLVYTAQLFSRFKADAMNPPQQDMTEGNHYLPNILFKAGYRFNLVFAQDEDRVAVPALDLLQNASSCQAKDPRDMVYSILGIATDIQSVPAKKGGGPPEGTNDKDCIIIDYTKRTQDVYIDFAKVHIRTRDHNPLDVITFSRPGNASPQQPGLDGLPSWVPDWSKLRASSAYSFANPTLPSRIREAHCPVYRYRASDGRVPSFSISADNALHVHNAIRFDHIAQAGEPYFEPGKPGWDFFRVLRAWQALALGPPREGTVTLTGGGLSPREQDPYPGGGDGGGGGGGDGTPQPETLWDAFDRTLSADMEMVGSRLALGQGFAFWQRSLAGFSVLGDSFADMLGPMAGAARGHAEARLEDAMRAVQLRIQRRRFFVTARGFFGLGPLDAIVGDEVFVLPGCSVPVILRREGKGLVGEAFVAGIMDGEAVRAVAGDGSDGDGERTRALRGSEEEVVIK